MSMWLAMVVIAHLACAGANAFVWWGIARTSRDPHPWNWRALVSPFHYYGWLQRKVWK